MSIVETLLAANGMYVSGRWPAHARWHGNVDFYRMLSQAKLVVVNGEGSIHHDRALGRQLLEIGAVARAARVPAALINAGWEANGPDLAAMLADFSIVAARDTVSADEMRKGAPAVRVVPDLSLCHPSPVTGHRKGIGVTDNVERLRALELDQLRRVLGGQTVSINYGRSYAGFLRQGISMRADSVHPRRLLRLLRLRHRLWQQRHTLLEEFVVKLAGLELLISGRFHACTLALVAGTPFIAQASNTSKIGSLIADAGLDPRRAQLPHGDGLTIRVADWGWSAKEVQARHAYLEHARREARVLFADLAALTA